MTQDEIKQLAELLDKAKASLGCQVVHSIWVNHGVLFGEVYWNLSAAGTQYQYSPDAGVHKEDVAYY